MAASVWRCLLLCEFILSVEATGAAQQETSSLTSGEQAKLSPTLCPPPSQWNYWYQSDGCYSLLLMSVEYRIEKKNCELKA